MEALVTFSSPHNRSGVWQKERIHPSAGTVEACGGHEVNKTTEEKHASVLPVWRHLNGQTLLADIPFSKCQCLLYTEDEAGKESREYFLVIIFCGIWENKTFVERGTGHILQHKEKQRCVNVYPSSSKGRRKANGRGTSKRSKQVSKSASMYRDGNLRWWTKILRMMVKLNFFFCWAVKSLCQLWCSVLYDNFPIPECVHIQEPLGRNYLWIQFVKKKKTLWKVRALKTGPQSLQSAFSLVQAAKSSTRILQY